MIERGVSVTPYKDTVLNEVSVESGQIEEETLDSYQDILQGLELSHPRRRPAFPLQVGGL